MKSLLIACSLILISLPSGASEIIQSGRPGQSIGAGTLTAGYLQLQSGLDYSSSDNEGLDSSSSLFLNVIRLGINEKFEMSAVLNYENQNFDDDQLKGVSGLKNFNLGFRSRIFSEQQGLIPQMAIQTRFKLKSVSKEYRPQNVAPVFILAMSHKISNSYSMTTNLGLSMNGNGDKSHEFWTASLSRLISNKLSCFFEFYGNTISQKNNIYFDTGFDYLLNNSFKLDFSSGWGKNSGVEEVFVSVGVSARAQLF